MTPLDEGPWKDQASDGLGQHSRGRSPSRWRALGTSAGILGGEGLIGYLHPALGEALAAADILVPLCLAVVLLTAILCGSSQTCERVFRLLRWITNRPEPPAPGKMGRLFSPASGSAPVKCLARNSTMVVLASMSLSRLVKP